jgi:hypothetical protein
MSQYENFMEQQKNANAIRPIFPPADEKESTVRAEILNTGEFMIAVNDNNIIIKDTKDIQRLARWILKLFHE